MAERYVIKVSNPELGKYRVVSGTDYQVVTAKAEALRSSWDAEERAQRAYRDAIERAQRGTQNAKEQKQRSGQEAEERTKKAKANLEKIKTILPSTLQSKLRIQWRQLVKRYSTPKPATKKEPPCLVYPIPPVRPEILTEPEPLVYLEYPPEPQGEESFPGTDFRRAHSIWLKKIEKIKLANQLNYEEHLAVVNKWNSPEHQFAREQALAEWTEVVKQIEVKNQRLRGEYKAAVEPWNLHKKEVEQWNVGRLEYEKNEVARLKAEYKSRLPKVVVSYCKRVLTSLDLPDGFQRKFDLEYIGETKILIVDHALPVPDDLTLVKEVKFVKARNKFTEVSLPESEVNRIYDDAIYQICLRTFYVLFDTDTAAALDSIVFNGWIESVDKATGNDTKGCVLSVQARKEEFRKINLSRVEPKACFKALKGIGSSTLHSLTPIAPVLKINRDDRRFVASHEVAGELDERFNLAAMDWEDFEHLIRELFEKEFSKSGSEVKVTQASRDGGVDAVVFDPDPIHGGKTIIQAKRYTNTVSVAAVRELYGTVLNEGAMKGILVTTADYGPDAYEFAQGKPLVLLSGANLLHLLEKHGHKAKIDIKEAKRILGEKVP